MPGMSSGVNGWRVKSLFQNVMVVPLSVEWAMAHVDAASIHIQSALNASTTDRVRGLFVAPTGWKPCAPNASTPTVNVGSFERSTYWPAPFWCDARPVVSVNIR